MSATHGGRERRAVILHTLKRASTPMSATRLAAQCGVSRQVIVQDVALLRAAGHEVLSTNRGYLLTPTSKPRLAAVQVFKCHHTSEQIRDELYAVVDNGGVVEDVFIYHRAYGTVRAEMNVASRRDADALVAALATGASKPLMLATGGYHYHTVSAGTEPALAAIEQRLRDLGFLAPLREFEPDALRGEVHPLHADLPPHHLEGESRK